MRKRQRKKNIKKCLKKFSDSENSMYKAFYKMLTSSCILCGKDNEGDIRGLCVDHREPLSARALDVLCASEDVPPQVSNDASEWRAGRLMRITT